VLVTVDIKVSCFMRTKFMCRYLLLILRFDVVFKKDSELIRIIIICVSNKSRVVSRIK
jgi:hypothetical protein